jgi:hypothetical protein
MALTPEQLAELQRLRQMFAPLAEQERRRQQATANAEAMANKKAKGGSAKDKALKAFMKGTKAKERLYHGTGNLESLTAFDPASTGKGVDQLGSGFYLSNDPEEASGYAGNFHSHTGEKNPSPGVIPAHVAIRNPIKLGKKANSLSDARVNLTHAQIKQIMEHVPNLRDPERSPLYNHVDTSRGVTPHMINDIAKLYTGNALHALENDMFYDNPTAYRTALNKVLGYDGVVKDFGNGRKHYVAWFPNQIKSAIGNRGNYDPNNPDLTMAQGGNVSKNPFDYQNKKHLHEVAKHLVKLGKFPLPKGIGATDILRDVLSSGKWQTLDDPRVNAAMRAAGHDSYYTQEKTGKQLNPMDGMKDGGKAGGDQYQELLKRHTKGERLSKAENEMLGLYHRVGGGKKLRKPVQEYKFETAPNPKVNMAPEKIITPEDLVGGYGIPFIGDSSMAGRLLTGAEGQQFDQPVELEGGHDYMRANAMHADPLQRAIWASALAKINHLTKKAKRVSENGEPVYGIHTSMSPTGVDFSHMPAEVLAELAKKAKITKKAKAMFNKEMRAQFGDFPGIDHPELHEMLRAKGSGNLRKHFVERMATDPYQEAGFPEIAMARLAVQHPNLMKHDRPGSEYVGSSIGRFRPDFGQVERPVNPHHSYPNVIGGEYVGALHGEKDQPLMTTTEFFPEFHRQRREFNAPKAGDRRAFELAQPVQKFDQQWLDQVMPLYLARRKKLVGKADGGAVDVAEIGVEEAPNLPVKAYSPFNFDGTDDMPFGGVDLDTTQAGTQLLSKNTMQAAQQQQQPQMPQGAAPAPQGGSNILQMTPQGKAMAAMKPAMPMPAKPAGMKRGGKVTMPSIDGMRYAMTVKSKKAK